MVMKDKIAIGLLVILLFVNVLFFINNIAESPAEIKQARTFVSEGDKYLAQHQWQEASDAYAKAEKLFRDKKRINDADDFAYIIKQIEIIKILTLKKRPIPVARKAPAKPIETRAVYRPEPSQKAAALKKVIDAKIVNIDAYFNLGNTYYSLGRYAEAEEAYRKVLAVNPKDVQALNGTGNCQNAKGEYAAAIKTYQASISLNPNNFNAFNNMGNTYRNMNNNERALAAYQKALELKPDNADVFYKLGMTHSLLGQKKQAVVMLCKARALYQERNNAAGAQRAERATERMVDDQ
jgi:tetratricopeptide (TPR) repeat protein